jgi:immunity protein 8 of polymorphic toxin system
VRAELRGVYSPDIADLEAYRPKDGDNFHVAITAFIGPADGPGEETFQFAVCTARWIQENPPPKGFQFMRSTILLTRWDYATLNRALTDLSRHTSADDWPSLALRLSRYGHWEYEDDTEATVESYRPRAAPPPKVAWWRRIF